MITFRQAVQADIAHLLALLAEIMEHHGEVPPEPERLTATLAAILDSPGHSLLVAESRGEVVGMCALIFSHSTWSASLVCELQDVVVAAGRRRNSIGQRLVRAAEAIARERGCSHLFLLAEAWNFGAHAFYRDLGMTEKTCLYFERDLRPAEDDSSVGLP
jgi:ribosomal protein S18 acetylase RimI-like enzyme